MNGRRMDEGRLITRRSKMVRKEFSLKMKDLLFACLISRTEAMQPGSHRAAEQGYGGVGSMNQAEVPTAVDIWVQRLSQTTVDVGNVLIHAGKRIRIPLDAEDHSNKGEDGIVLKAQRSSEDVRETKFLSKSFKKYTLTLYRISRSTNP